MGVARGVVMSVAMGGRVRRTRRSVRFYRILGPLMRGGRRRRSGRSSTAWTWWSTPTRWRPCSPSATSTTSTCCTYDTPPLHPLLTSQNLPNTPLLIQCPTHPPTHTLCQSSALPPPPQGLNTDGGSETTNTTTFEGIEKFTTDISVLHTEVYPAL